MTNFFKEYPATSVFAVLIFAIASLVVVGAGSAVSTVLSALLGAIAIGFGFIALLEIL